MPVPLHWHTEPFLLLSLLFLGWGYAVCTWPLRPLLASGVCFDRLRAFAYYLALIGTYFTVASPLDQIGEDFLFSVHMVQHMLLIYILPPLFIFGIPSWGWDLAFKNSRFRTLARFLTHPVVAGGSFTLVYSLWHFPVLYEATLQNKHIHIFEHFTMFVTALLVWWLVMAPSKVVPALSYPLRMLFVFVLMVGQFPVFGVLTFSGDVLYATYEYAPRLFELTPLQDQILGGVMMKVFNMVASLLVFGISFNAWYKTSESA
jgi:putative membrane protein